MKKLILTAAVACGTLFSYAQTQPDRVVIYKQGFDPQSILAERVDSIAFMQIEGKIEVAVTAGEYSYDESTEQGEVPVTIIRGEGCAAFQCMIARADQVDAITDESQLAAIIEQQAGDLYWQDYTEAEGAVFNELELLDGYDYYVLCLAYDNWGTPCSVSKAKFNVPKIPLQGDPQVEVTFSDITDRSFKATLTPNADVSSFGYIYAWKGQIALQSAMFGGVEGYLNGMFAAKSETEVVINGDCNYYEPGSEWEVGTLAKDADGRYDKAILHTVKTALHGDGTTTPDVEIKVGNYFMSEWWDENAQANVDKPTLHVDFTPNAGANCFRYSVWTKDVYDQYSEECIESVATDMDPNSWATSYYYNIDPCWDEFQLEPNTAIVIVAVPKANDGTWGEPVIVEYTTPAEVGPAEETPAATAAKGLAMPATKSAKAESTVNFQRQFQNGGRMQTLPFMMQPVKKAVSTGKTIKVVDLSK